MDNDNLTLVVSRQFLSSPTSSPASLTLYIYLTFSGARFLLEASATDLLPYIKWGNSTIMREEENIIDKVKDLVDIDFWIPTEDIKSVKCQLKWIARALKYEQTGTTDENCSVEKIHQMSPEALRMLSTLLNGQQFLFGKRPTSFDAIFLGLALVILYGLPENCRLKNELKTHKDLIQYVEKQGLGRMEIDPPNPSSTHQGLKWKSGSVERVMQPLEQRSSRQYEPYEVLYLTKDFKEEIAEGTFGNVYKGWEWGHNKPENTSRVAVKVCSKMTERRRKEYDAEVKYGPKLMHENFTKQLGHYMDQEKAYLISEFQPNGTLSDRLEDLDWKTTVKIIKGLCRAIEYMHSKVPALVNPDLKVNNILLDRDFNTKVSDFGYVQEENEARYGGTPGYTDPDVIYNGIATKETDMHNFGIVFLYLLTKKPGHFTKVSVSEIMNNEVEKGIIVVHEALKNGGCTQEIATKMFRIIQDCVHENKKARPRISDVIDMLDDMGL